MIDNRKRALSFALLSIFLLTSVNVQYAFAASTSTTKASSWYENTKLKAYQAIRAETDKGNLENVSLVWHISDTFPTGLSKLYVAQINYASKLYGSFFAKQETINVYMNTEKDSEYLKSAVLFRNFYPEFKPFFDEWAAGKTTQHNFGSIATFMEYPEYGNWQGHTGVIVFSGATQKSLRRQAIQVMPHEYFHVVQDYFFNPKIEAYKTTHSFQGLDDGKIKEMFIPWTLREGGADTISFAEASSTSKDYLSLYKDFILEKKSDKKSIIFKKMKSVANVVSILNKIEKASGDPEAHMAAYPMGALLYEWVIAEFGFDGYRKLLVNQLSGESFEDNVKLSLGITKSELYSRAAPHILAAFK